MNYLELVNDLMIEAGVAGQSVTTIQGTLPLEIQQLKIAVRDSWIEIQNKPNYWGFHFVSASMVVPLNASVLNPPEFSQVADWELDSFRIADAGKTRKDAERLRFRDFLWFRDHEGADITRTGRPQSITVDPNTESLIIAPPSDQIRTLFYDYWRTPQELTLDGDVPIMPKRFHKLIVGKALKRHAQSEAAPELLVKAADIISEYQNNLHVDQGEGYTTSGLIYY